MDTTMENVAVASAEARRQLESGSGSPGGFGGETPGAANPRTPGAHLAPSPLTLGYGATYDYEDPMDPSFVPKTPGLPADYQSDQEGIDMASVIAQADESHAQYEHQHSRVPENDLDPRVIARRQSAYDRNGATLETSPNTDHFFQRFSSPTTHPYTSSAYGASSTIAGVGSIDVPSFHIGSAQHRSPNGFQNGNDQYSAYSYRASRMGSDDVFTAPALPASAYNSYGSGARQRTLMQPGYSGPSTGNLHSLSMNSQDGETDYSELLPAHESSRVTTRAPVNPARIPEPMIAAPTGRESRPSSPAQEDLESDEPENQRMPAPRKRSAKAPSTPKSATKSTPKPTKSGKKPSGSSVASSEPRQTRAGPRAGKAVDNKVIPDTFEQCDLADRTLVEMRDAGHSWADCKKRYAEISGDTHGHSTIPNRYERLKTKFVGIREEHQKILAAAKKQVEKEFERIKWKQIADLVLEQTGTNYVPMSLQRCYRKLMQAEGFDVNSALARDDVDFAGGSSEDEGQDEDREEEEQEEEEEDEEDEGEEEGERDEDDDFERSYRRGEEDRAPESDEDGDIGMDDVNEDEDEDEDEEP